MRHTKTVEITDEGRDKGKRYVITEMPASQGEWWGARVLLSLANANREIPEEVSDQGLAGIAQLGPERIFSLMHPSDAKPLLDEMFECIKCETNIKDESGKFVVRALIEDDIEEIQTRISLRKAWIENQLGFSLPAVDLKSFLSWAGMAKHTLNT